jgi:predicted PurR-regulated permease PerM
VKEKPSDNFGSIYKLNQGHYFLFFLLIIVFIACYHIIKPYINPIVLAAILAIILSPIQQRLEKILHERKNLAALISCTLLTIIVVLPLMIILIALINQGITSFTKIQQWVADDGFNELMNSPFVSKLMSFINKFLPDIKKFFPEVDLKNLKFNESLLKASSSIGKGLINQGGELFGNLAALIGKFFLMIFTFFFLIRDREKFSRALFHLVPLSSSQEERIISKIKSVSQSALLGTFVTAIAQGAAGGLAFWIAGLPGLFWGSAMAFASLIPLVGTALIWVPATIYLFFIGDWGYGIFMFLWCSIVVGMIDNFVRPIFMSGAGDMSTMLIFFAILGGLNYFGLIGLLYGPLIFGLAIVLLYIYSLEFEAFLNHQDER